MKQLLCAALALCVACCASRAPVQYLLLSPEEVPIPGEGPTVALGPITLAPYLSRDALAVRGGEHTVRYASGQLWAEPLEDGTRRVLAAALQRQAALGAVTAFPARAAVDVLARVEVHFERFGLEAGAVRAQGYWRVLDPAQPQSALARAPFDITEPSDTTGSAPARALSRALQRLALEIGRALPERGDPGR